jgi:hypothetical protein
MAHGNKETVTLAWCDNGSMDGRFADSIIGSIINTNVKIPITSQIRVEGNQIGRQRQVAFDQWADVVKSDWLLWVDSDISPNIDAFNRLWETADKLIRPVVSGIYFIFTDFDPLMPQPLPAAFLEVGGEQSEMQYLHPLPEEEVVKVDYAGFGFVLMHKSIIDPMRKISPDYSLFGEIEKPGAQFVSEDIAFFRKMKKANIPLYVNTLAQVTHMKRFALNGGYYNMYWNSVLQKENKE